METDSCIFCQNFFDKTDLIKIDENAIEIDNIIIEFSEVIEEIFSKKLNNQESALICEDCKDLLVQCYVFYENIQNNNRHFIESQNLTVCKRYLKECPEKHVICESIQGCLVLVPHSKKEIIDLWKSFEIVDDENVEQELEVDCQSERILMDPEIERIGDEIIVDTIEIKVVDDDIQNEPKNVEVLENFTKHLCKKCNLKFENLEEYKIHLASSHPASRHHGKFFCERCSHQFTTQAHFTSHKNGHQLFDTLSQHMSFPKCEFCNRMFADSESFEIHSQNHDDTRPINKVGFFLKFGIKKDNCDESEWSSPTNENASICGHCLKMFNSDEELKNHLLVFHAVQLTCPVDLRTFNNNQAFTIHMRNNHIEYFPNSSYACSVCKITFETLYEKLAHMKNECTKAFECNHCSKTFSRKCHLIKHLKLVSGELNITCEKCNKVCRDKHDYKIHLLTHSSARLFECSLCSKSYKTSSARAAHLQTHLEVVICTFCGMQFKSRRTMKKHVKIKHENQFE